MRTSFSQILIKHSNFLNVIKFSIFGALVSGSRFFFMFYFSTIVKHDQTQIAEIVFINGNNALFIGLYSSLVLTPLAQYRKFNNWAAFSFISLSIIVSLLWTSIYGYSLNLNLLMVLVMISHLFYETSRRILYLLHEPQVVRLDIAIAVVYLGVLALSLLFNFDIINYLVFTTIGILIICSLFLKYLKHNILFSKVGFKEFLMLNHSGVGQGILFYISGNFIFQIVALTGNSQIFTKVNIIRIWTAPIGLLLNGLDFVFSRDEYKGRMSHKILLSTLILCFISLIFLNNETLLYCLAFIFAVPFQFWIRETQIILRQKENHSLIWKVNLGFGFLSILTTTILTSYVSWYYWSWYIIISYFLIWIGWKIGRRKE